MHLLIPYAHTCAITPDANALAQHLQPPHLCQLLSCLVHHTATELEDKQPTLSIAQQHVMAQMMRISFEDGFFPDAALHMLSDHLVPANHYWVEITPSHWEVGLEQMTMHVPEQLDLSEQESRSLFNDIAALLADKGWKTQWGAPLRWYASHDLLSSLPTAPVERVIGHHVGDWLLEDSNSDSGSDSAKTMRQLQNELQMLLYQHPVNRERRAKRLMDVNSVWFSGNGQLPSGGAQLPPNLLVANQLRLPSLSHDGPAWLQAWREIDAGPAANALNAGQAVQVTLCGLDSWHSWQGQKNIWAGLKRMLKGKTSITHFLPEK